MKRISALILMIAWGLMAPLQAAGTETFTPTATPSFTPSPTVTLTAVCNGTFGCVTCNAGAFAGNGGSELIASQFVLSQDGTANGIYVYLTGTTGGLIRAGIYADNANVPGALIAQSGEQATVEGWNLMPIYPTFLVQGTYWLSQLSEPNRIHFNMNTSGRRLNLNFSYGPMPTAIPSVGISNSSSYAMYASYCPGPPIFFTPTPTMTPTPTPIPFKASGGGKLVLGPVPAKQGTPLCLYFDQAPASSTWEVYNLRGQRVSTLSFGLGEQACWDTKKIAPGLYIVRAEVKYAAGSSGTLTQKVVVLP